MAIGYKKSIELLTEENARKDFHFYFGHDTKIDMRIIHDLMTHAKLSVATWEEIQTELKITKDEWSEQNEIEVFYDYANRMSSKCNDRQSLLIPYLNAVGHLRIIREREMPGLLGLESGAGYVAKNIEWIFSSAETNVDKQASLIETMQHERVHMFARKNIGLIAYDVPYATTIGLLTAAYTTKRFNKDYSRWNSLLSLIPARRLDSSSLKREISNLTQKYKECGEPKSSYTAGAQLAIEVYKYFKNHTQNTQSALLSAMLFTERISIGYMYEDAQNSTIRDINNPGYIKQIQEEMDGLVRHNGLVSNIKDLAQSTQRAYEKAFGATEASFMAIINNVDQIVAVHPCDNKGNKTPLYPRYQWRNPPLN